MKPIIILFSLFFCLNNLSSQADLVSFGSTVSTTQVDRGGYLVIATVLGNIGNVSSPSTNVTFHLTTDNTIDDNDKIGELLLPELLPNQRDTLRFIFAIPPTFESNIYNAAIWIDQYQIVNESDDNNAYCVLDNTECLNINVTNFLELNTKLPYPILFIHGLESGAGTWFEVLTNLINEQNLIYGGNLKYCLNPDGDFSTSDGFILDYADIDSLRMGDLYSIDFEVDRFGNRNSNNGLSNQSAIFKQGIAVQDAISKVLSITGKDKVMLVGHSMGGLAIRQYLQNEDWQISGKHHVSKIHTIDTPHGGSNAGSTILTTIFTSIDINSEAVRDLRYDDFSFGFIGTYIDGGLEDLVTGLYYNNDVNINGTETDLIVGINQKPIPNDLDYSCSVAEFNDFPLVDIVEAERADLNNFLMFNPPFNPPIVPTFSIDSDHQGIVERFDGVLQGMDEPSNKELALEIQLGSPYVGHITTQAPNLNKVIDTDYFKFNIENEGILSIGVFNVLSSNYNLSIQDFGSDLLYQSDVINHCLETEIYIKAGTYYLKVEGIPNLSFQFEPYYLALNHKIVPPLVAEFNVDNNEVCVGNDIQFMDQSNGEPTKYLWSFEGGEPNQSTIADPIIQYNERGKYDVRLVVENEHTTDTILFEEYVIVEDTPSPDFLVDVLNEGTVSFPIQTNAFDDNTTFEWDFGDGEISALPFISPIHEYDESGTYDVKLTVENFCGIDSIIKDVSVFVSKPITAEFESSADDACAYTPIQFFDNSTGNPDSWSWSFEGGEPSTSNLQNPIITYQESGSYNISFTASNNLYNSTIEVGNFEVSDIPLAQFGINYLNNTEVEFIDASHEENSNLEYLWDFGDGNTSTDKSPSHEYSISGEFDVTLTVSNQCGSNSITQEVNIMTTSVLESDKLSNIKIFPNPNRGEFSILFDNEIKFSKNNIEIYSSKGELVNFNIIKNNQNQFKITSKSLSPGLYYLKVRFEEVTQNFKILVID